MLRFAVPALLPRPCLALLLTLTLAPASHALQQTITPDVPAPARTAPAAPAATATQPAPTQPAPAAKPKKKGKEVYTGPTNVIVLPATPLLDPEGRQMLDPDAKPMFNEPVSQKRDKKGHPEFDAAGKPVFTTPQDMGYDERGRKIHVKKVSLPKMTALSISRGTLTVDGMTGKAALNYDIADFKYLYIYTPWIGITVVSNTPFPGAKEQPGAFKDKTLTVAVADHTLQLASDKRLLGPKPESAFVLVDRDFRLPSRLPEIGFGPIRKAPYSWPGSKPNAEIKGIVAPPPLPKALRPVQALAPCPAGQMRQPGPAVLPGQTEVTQPCVPIVTKPVPTKPAPPATTPPPPAATPTAPATAKP